MTVPNTAKASRLLSHHLRSASYCHAGDDSFYHWFRDGIRLVREGALLDVLDLGLAERIAKGLEGWAWAEEDPDRRAFLRFLRTGNPGPLRDSQVSP